MQQQHIDFVVDALEHRFGSDVDHETLAAVVEADFSRLSRAPIQEYVPVLVEKDVRELMLRRLAG